MIHMKLWWTYTKHRDGLWYAEEGWDTQEKAIASAQWYRRNLHCAATVRQTTMGDHYHPTAMRP